MKVIEDLQDEVLRAIGRNVLNLQKIEGMMKFIASSTGMLGATKDVVQPMQDLERSIKSRNKVIKRLPMGRLAEAMSKGLRSEPDTSEEILGTGYCYSVEVSFSIGDESFVKDLDKSLDKIVRERNDLIHKRLVQFKFQSKEECEELIRELNEQRERIKPLFEALSSVCSSLRQA